MFALAEAGVCPYGVDLFIASRFMRLNFPAKLPDVTDISRMTDLVLLFQHTPALRLFTLLSQWRTGRTSDLLLVVTTQDHQ
ncbi:hypothetical protein [Stenotrophomonas sp. Iso1]|uniref:hypothetical protein n=1 Tax=Stenotrophomonas sp. Iso1 TaxID=2977283 RepID=UPI0022B781C3|nr:hypothetical protein [Stenotrophomonas sp. Iso1]